MATTYERLDYGSSDGSQWGGASTDRIAFFGAIPAAQMAISTRISTTLFVSSLSSGVTTWGFATSTSCSNW